MLTVPGTDYNELFDNKKFFKKYLKGRKTCLCTYTYNTGYPRVLFCQDFAFYYVRNCQDV